MNTLTPTTTTLLKTKNLIIKDTDIVNEYYYTNKVIYINNTILQKIIEKDYTVEIYLSSPKVDYIVLKFNSDDIIEINKGFSLTTIEILGNHKTQNFIETQKILSNLY